MAFLTTHNPEPLTALLEQPKGTPLDLTDAKVCLYAQHTGGLHSVEGECEVTGAGEVRFAWDDAELSAGQYHGEFVVTRSDGSTQTVPNGSPFSFIVRQSLR